MNLTLVKTNSLFNNEPVVVIVTGNSKNKKTGNVIQSWIIPEASLKIQDTNIANCGDCSLRDTVCYLLKWREPRQVQNAYYSGNYPMATPIKLAAMLEDEVFRFGAYGEATAVPFEVWEPVFKHCKTYIGYTHQWRTCDQRWKGILQASVETEADALLAQSMGWKTFRVKAKGAPQMENEIQCLNEKNPDITCKLCKKCDGKSHNVVINVHGRGSKKFGEMYGNR